MKIYVRDNDVSKALRILKKKLTEEGDIKDFRKKDQFIDNSTKKRLAKQAAKLRWRKQQLELDKKRAHKEQLAIKIRKTIGNNLIVYKK